MESYNKSPVSLVPNFSFENLKYEQMLGASACYGNPEEEYFNLVPKISLRMDGIEALLLSKSGSGASGKDGGQVSLGAR
jgi:hypothetical protein